MQPSHLFFIHFASLPLLSHFYITLSKYPLIFPSCFYQISYYYQDWIFTSVY